MPRDSTEACAQCGDKLCVTASSLVHTLGRSLCTANRSAPSTTLTCADVVHPLCTRNSWRGSAPPAPPEHGAAQAKPYPGPMGAVRAELVDAVRRELERGGDPARAKSQQAYMKSPMPFRGISAPELKATLRPLLADPAYLLTFRDQWEAAIRGLWDGAQFREER